MEQDQKYVFRRLGISGRNGQAAVEYILMLVIIVSLVLGAKKAFQNVNNFMSSYIGDYVSCLMEYGELPSLGVEETTLKKHVGGGAGGGKVCASQFAGFTFSGGVPYTGGDGGGGGSGTNSSGRNGRNSESPGNSNSANSKNSSQNAGKDGKDASSKSSADKRSENSRQARGGQNQSPYDSGRIKRSSGSYGTADGGIAAGNTKVLEEDAASKNKRGRRKGRYRPTTYSYDRNKYRAITGSMAADIEKSLPRKPLSPTTSVRTVADEGSVFGPYKKTFTPPERRPDAVAATDESGFGFGNILKWLLIAGMVIAIVIFFGGQLLNYSNSQD